MPKENTTPTEGSEEQVVIQTMDIDLAKNYVSTLIEPACVSLETQLTTEQALMAESYIIDFINQAEEKGFGCIAQDAFAEFALAGVMKAMMHHSGSNTQ